MRAPRPRVLYLVHRVPYPPDKGDRIRNFHILKFLSQCANVDLACLADEPLNASATAVFDRLCQRWQICQMGPFHRRFAAAASLACGRTLSEGAFSSRDLRRVLGRWTTEMRYDAVIVSSSAMMQYLDMRELRNVRAIVDFIDVDSEKWLEYSRAAVPPLSWLFALEGKRLRKVECNLRPNVASIVLVSDDEVNLYRRECRDFPVHAVGNGVDLEYYAAMPPHDATGAFGCIFVGAMDYPPNIDAAVWFAREVWPQIGRRFKQARFLIVGRNPSKSVRKLATIPGVEVTGTVADVRPWYAESAVAVAPLRIARGIQNKVLEAMAMSLPTVVSPQALCGLSARPGDEVLVANSPDDWTEDVCRLLHDRSLRGQIGHAGRRYVERHHSWSNRLRPFEDLLHAQIPPGQDSCREEVTP